MTRHADWRHAAACRNESLDLFFPVGETGPAALQIKQAKAICRRCPVIEVCAQRALENREPSGAWGGLSESDRRAILRRRGIRIHPEPQEAEENPQDAVRAERPRTLAQLFAQRTLRLPGGHIDWTACTSVTFKGDNYTPRQIAFELDRGYKPTGTVLTTCDHKGCVQAMHLTDAEERGQCGTETAVRRHVAKGEPLDEKCQAVALVVAS